MKPILLGTLGYPGSGKTYFSERLAKKAHFFHLSADVIRHTLFTTPKYTLDEHEAVFGLMDYLTVELLKKGMSVIYDANFNFKKSRRKLEKIAKETHAVYKLVWIQTDEHVAIGRLNTRAKYTNSKKKLLYRPIKIEVFHHYKSEMELPTKKEPVIIIDGHAPFLVQFESIAKELNIG